MCSHPVFNVYKTVSIRIYTEELLFIMHFYSTKSLQCYNIMSFFKIGVIKYICIAIKNDLVLLLGAFSNPEILTSGTKTQLTRDHGSIMQMILLANPNCCQREVHRIVSCLILLLISCVICFILTCTTSLPAISIILPTSVGPHDSLAESTMPDIPATYKKVYLQFQC